MHLARSYNAGKDRISLQTRTFAPRGFNYSIQLLLADDIVWSKHRCTKLYGDMHRNGLSGGSGGDIYNTLTFPTMSSLHNAVKFMFDSRNYTCLRLDSLVPATTSRSPQAELSMLVPHFTV